MRYSGYGSYDTQPLLDGDEGFVGLNTRLDPTQLQEGILSESKNIRLDKGTARSRKGCTLHLGSSSSVETPLDAISYDSGSRDDVLIVSALSGSDEACHPRAYSSRTGNASPAGIFQNSRRE